MGMPLEQSKDAGQGMQERERMRLFKLSPMRMVPLAFTVTPKELEKKDAVP